MTNEAMRLLAAALKTVKMDGSFAPADVGHRAGLSKAQSEAAARELSNAGVLVLGFDCAANFSADYRKSRARAERLARGESEGKSRAKGERSKKSTRPDATAAAAKPASKNRRLAEPSVRG